MLGWVARIFLVIAGLITSVFVTRDALNFDIIQMVVAVCIFTFAVVIAAFWPMLKDWFKRRVKRHKNH